MNLRTLAYKNVKHHADRYIAYFLSCTFAVWLFFQSLSLLLHPIMKEEVIPEEFVTLMYLVQIVILLFSFLFIGYSLSAFLRSRKQEIGLMQVMGMDVNHITRLLLWENMIVGFSSMFLGMVIGFVTSKFFFLLVSRVLDLPKIIPFHFSFPAVLITSAIFFVIFGSLSLWNRFSIRKGTIVQLFRDAVKPKKAQPFSWTLTFIAILSLVLAYGFMWNTQMNELSMRMPLIVFLILLGTYLAFTQASVAIIEKLSRTKSFVYRGKNLFIFSQLRFRLKDNARILFMVAILSSIVLTAVGVSFTYYVYAERLANDLIPYHLSINGEPGEMSTDKVKKMVKQHGLAITGEWHFPFVDLSSQPIQGLPKGIYLTSASVYQKLLSNQGNSTVVRLKENQAIFSRNSGVWKEGFRSIPAYPITVAGQTVQVHQEFHGKIFNESIVTTNLLVVNDDVYKQIAQRFPAQRLTVHAYHLSDWKQSKPLLDALTQQIEQKEKRKVYPYETLHGTVIMYDLLKELFAPLMFASLFIGILFFLASGSILYFRLFTEASDDRKEIAILNQLGLSLAEAKSVLGWQVRLLFYLPFLVGWFHAFFALRLFSQLFEQPVWNTFAIISISYLLLYGVYYLWTKKKYMQVVMEDSYKVG